MSKAKSTTTAEIGFEQVLERFMSERPGDLAQSSVETYRYGINSFKTWMDGEGYTLQDLDAWTVGEYWTWLRDENDYSESTLESYTKATRAFLKFGGEKNVVQEGLHEHVENYHASKEGRQWDQEVDVERIDEIVEFLERAYPTERNPLIFRLLAKTGLRRSGLRALDVKDVKYEGGPRLYVRSRENTKLKGRKNHNRIINISQDLYNDLQAYVEDRRIDVVDEYGRNPLFTTKNGRVSIGLIVDTVHYYSSPHISGAGECQPECEVGPNPNKHETKKCNKSFSPHTLKKYHVTKLRNRGIGFESIGERVATNPDTLRVHYDESKQKQQADRRKETLADVL